MRTAAFLFFIRMCRASSGRRLQKLVNIAFCLLPVFFTGTISAQETPGESFIGVHYSGMAYNVEDNDPRPWNSGFGFTGHLGLGSHFATEVGWDKAFLRETHGPIDTMSHSTYTFSATLYSFRLCLNETGEKWSGQLFIGMGLSGANRIQHKKFYEDHEPVTHVHRGIGFFMPQLGVRASWHLTNHLSAYIAVIGMIRFHKDEFSGGHYPGYKTYYDPFNAPGFLWVNAGIAYRGLFDPVSPTP